MFFLSNSFEALNVDPVIEEVETGNKASTSGVQEEEKVDYSDAQGSEDEVESVDNEMASYLASKSYEVGYGTSLLEQWVYDQMPEP
ncbi:hypothetical protein Tco_1398789, partial [Tanacetum coccineum]